LVYLENDKSIMKKEEVLEIRIELRIDSQCSLFLVLGKDGALARQGSGTKDISKERFLGQSDGQYFKELIGDIDEEIFDHFGVYDLPEKDGSQCHLSVVFKDEKGVSGFDFYFGYKSKNGPQIKIAGLLDKAVKITEDWYREALNKKRKKWWQL
jgi:hypothetical protein